ncbi:MAG: BglII/BstYI family type II restriction endonuclease [Thaumarchaeota archaeon]|nr:BglII/BstYI family type II restriction endonuclease [Nitrososphaerota archaeon]
MKIDSMKFYNGSCEKIARLGMSDMLFELLNILMNTRIFLEEKKDANSGKVVRQQIDLMLEDAQYWVKTVTGDLDWVKSKKTSPATTIKMGVEIQMSARSDLVIRDLLHMRESMKQGKIEIAVLVVPSDKMSRFLPDRAPSLSESLRYVEKEFEEIQQFPLVLISVEHDGSGEACLVR